MGYDANSENHAPPVSACNEVPSVQVWCCVRDRLWHSEAEFETDSVYVGLSTYAPSLVKAVQARPRACAFGGKNKRRKKSCVLSYAFASSQCTGDAGYSPLQQYPSRWAHSVRGSGETTQRRLTKVHTRGIANNKDNIRVLQQMLTAAVNRGRQVTPPKCIPEINVGGGRLKLAA